MKKRIVFIIPYFGHFNNYFNLFLKSCETNSELCDWIIFTNNRGNYNYPKNVKVIYMEWEEMKNYIQGKFDFEISLNYPYKLCDFKVAYGYIFSDYISEYTHWGHCDVDLIWGNIKKFLPDTILSQYKKIFTYGHCTIYQNSDENNKLFFKKLNGKERYKEVFQSKKNNSFDEEYKNSINNIYLNEKQMVFEDSYAANIYTKSSNFKLTVLAEDKQHYEVEKNKNGFFVWNKGFLYRYIRNGNKLEKKEYLYIHMQSRKMKNKILDDTLDTYKIIPNVFEPLEIEIEDLSAENFSQIKKKYFNLHYFILRTKNLFDKIKKYLKD